MPSLLTTYDALPSDPTSRSPTPHQPETQRSCGEVKPSIAPDGPSRTWISQCWTNWKWELAACLLSLAVPVIIFATVYPHDGQPLPQWPFNISINSLLSVYTLVLKAAIGVILTSCIGQLQWTWFTEIRPLTDVLRFDNATRGADGALRLIWRQRFRQPLAVIGSSIVILVVAVDPFVQQLVQPVECAVEVSGSDAAATLPRTNVFERYGYSGNANASIDTRPFYYDFEPRSKAIDSALNNAIFPPVQDPPWQCSTGNCTFPDTYGTIGICYSCQDVSDDVSIHATCSNSNSTYSSHHPTSGEDCPANSSFTFESNLTSIEYGMDVGTKMTFSSLGRFDMPLYVAVAKSGSNPCDATLSGGARGLDFKFIIGAIPNSGGRIDWTTSDNLTCNQDGPDLSWGCRGYGSASCFLHPCVKIYNATISAGILQENLVASSSDTAWGMIYDVFGQPTHLTLIDSHCSAQTGVSSNQEETTENRWLPYNLNLTAPDADLSSAGNESDIPLPSNVTSLVESGCLYLMEANLIMYNAGRYLTGTVQANEVIYRTGDRSNGSIESLSGFDGSVFLQSIYNWGDTDFERVQDIIANISDSLTTYIRTHGSSQLLGSTNLSRTAQGNVYHYATCLQVRWPWISFPASLSVLTALFSLQLLKSPESAAVRFGKAHFWRGY